MSAIDIYHHPNDVDLDWDEAVAALNALQGARIAVRIVDLTRPDSLVAVFRGHLGALADDRLPTLFWPVYASSEDEPGDLEAAGIYLQQERFAAAVARGRERVLAFTQGPIIVNVRNLEDPPED